MEIGRITSELFPQVVKIEEESFTSEIWTADMLAEEAVNPLSRFFVLSENGRAVGFGIVRIIETEAEILDIAVSAAERGRGFGRLLLQALLKEARSAGATDVYLEVSEVNSVAKNLYSAFGFTECGRRKKYYGGIHDAILMRRIL